MDYTIKLNSGYEMPVVGMGSWLGKDEEVKFLKVSTNEANRNKY